MASSTSGLFSMSNPTISPTTLNATSLPASAAGAELYKLRLGPWIERYGLAHVLVSLSPRQAKASGLLTSGTYGPPGSISSSSARLNKFLVSRLQARLDSNGSTLFALTWKVRRTPSLAPICALRASAHRISDKGCGSWQTPRGEIGGDTAESHEARQSRVVEKHGRRMGTPLEVQAQWASWPTPNAGPQNDGDSTWQQRRVDLKARHGNGNGFGMTLGQAASLSPALTAAQTAQPAAWSTPRANKWGFPDAHGSHEAP